jgi:hypothetical protein
LHSAAHDLHYFQILHLNVNMGSKCIKHFNHFYVLEWPLFLIICYLELRLFLYLILSLPSPFQFFLIRLLTLVILFIERTNAVSKVDWSVLIWILVYDMTGIKDWNVLTTTNFLLKTTLELRNQNLLGLLWGKTLKERR